MTYVLWILQSLLAGLFIFAGAMKLVTPGEVLQTQSPLPVLFLQFVGVAELLGGVGLILPGLLRIGTRLTVIAAIELVHVMLAATILTLTMGLEMAALAAMPLLVGALTAFVAYGRARLAPHRAHRPAQPRSALQPAH